MTSVSLDQNSLAVLQGIIQEAGNIPFSLDTKIEDLQLDSLEFLDLHMQLERKFNVDIAVERLVLCNTVNDLKLLIESLQT